MDQLKEMGEFVRSASSTIEAPIVRRLKEAFAEQAATPQREQLPGLIPLHPRGQTAQLSTSQATEIFRIDDGKKRSSVNIGVASFEGDDGTEPDLARLQPLPFANERVGALRNALTSLGYSCSDAGAPNPSSKDLGRLVEDAIDASNANDVLVVHILSHGQTAETGAVYAIGSDGSAHGLTDVEQWLKKVENLPDQPLTLFLLDLCHSGVAARFPWQTSLADGSSRAWVIAACEPDRDAFGGRFTQATTNVLQALFSGELDIDGSVSYVPIGTIAREIRREVNRLAQEIGSLPQQVTCSVIDISVHVDLPFFPNPNYRHDERRQVRGRIDAALAPFLDDLDDIFDPRHFVSRAAGHGPMAEYIGSGCFSGRTDELINLTAWINQDEDGAIRLVTGSAGVGKSALIGVVVCAAHPALRAPTQQLWKRVYPLPARVPHMAAVHARQRSVMEIAQSLAKQLGFPVPESPEVLVETMSRSPSTPTLVIDALDEALEPVALMHEVLFPLVAARDSVGNPVCRLLVGVRSDPEFMALRNVAEAAAGLIDLDAVPDDRLRRDLEEYVEKLLKSQTPYDQRAYGPPRAAFAGAVAETLVYHRSGKRWGEFLVAALYTHHLLTTYAPISNVSLAESFGTKVPHELHDVLELDLSQRTNNAWLRPVLAALAQARGEGMPASLIRAVAPAFTAADNASASEINEALDTVRFYLRRATDSDGTTLYRLFHQGLTDYLCEHPVDRAQTVRPEISAELVLSCMLKSLAASEGDKQDFRHWDLAEPYLLRHALQHAIDAQLPHLVAGDPEYLIYADPSVVGSFFEGASLPNLQLLGTAYRSVVEELENPSVRERRQALALAAVTHGLPHMAWRLAHPSGQAPLGWQPLWALAERQSASRVEWLLPGHKGGVTALATVDLDGRATVIVGTGSGEVICWDLASVAPSPRRLIVHDRAITSLSCRMIANEHYLVSASLDAVLMTNIKSGKPITRVLRTENESTEVEQIISVHCTELDGQPVLITGDRTGIVRFWAMDADREVRNKLPFFRGGVIAISTTKDGKFVLAAGEDRTVRVWNTETCSDVKLPDAEPTLSTPMIVIELSDRSALWVGDNKGRIRILGIPDGRLIGMSQYSDIGLVTAATSAAAMSDVAGAPAAATVGILGGQDGMIHVVDLFSGRAIASPDARHAGAVTALTSLRLDGSLYAASGGLDGNVLIREVRSPSIEGDSLPVRTVAVLPLLNGYAVITAGSSGGFKSWDLETGEYLGGRSDTPTIARLKEVIVGGQGILVATSEDQRLLCWDPNTNTEIKIDVSPPSDLPHPDSQSASYLDDLLRWRDSAFEDNVIPSKPQTFSLLDGRIVTVGPNEYGVLTVADVMTEEALGHMLGARANSVTAVVSCVLDARPVIVSGTEDGFLCLWDLRSRRLLDLLPLPAGVQMIVPAEKNQLVVLAGGQLFILKRATGTMGNVL